MPTEDEESGSVESAAHVSTAPAPATDFCTCGAASFPSWSCGECGKKVRDFANRKHGAKCGQCGANVSFVYSQCQFCGNANIHKAGFGSKDCQENAGGACHGLRAA